MALHTYLFFTNTTREAMTRYHEIFGGELEIMSAADLPPGEEPPFETTPDMVMHAALTLSDGSMLMASDDPTGDGSGVKGAAVHYSLSDQDEARRVFEALVEGGQVYMPLEATFWSPLFGSCLDRFGVGWNIDVEA
jgi:PhnB protein